jgi:C-terminal processing protease CtpA/Prc
MKPHRSHALAFLLLLPLSMTAVAADAAQKSGNPTFDRTVNIVLDRFYDTGKLAAFTETVDTAVAGLPGLADAEPAVVSDAIDHVLSSLETSHTARYTADTVEYYELADVFRYALGRDLRRVFRGREVVYDGIGIASARIDDATFVTDVYDGGPADAAGILAGDELLTVDGAPFAPVESFRGKSGQTVTVSLRREQAAEPMTIDVPVERLEPSDSLVSAIADSVEEIERDGKRIGYLRIWAYTDRNVPDVLSEALAGPLADADGLVLDLRSRWGGAPGDAAEMFVGRTADMRMIDRDGDVSYVNERWRKPVVAIIDEGTRSGMEVLAYSLKKNGIPLVGTETAGDVVAGTGFLLPDDSFLIVAVANVFVDDARLEGNPVQPDIAVPFDIRYADGADPQLDAALAEMDGQLAGARMN